MGLIPPQDASFLISESREHPMHVAGLHVFELPPDAGPDYLSDLYQDLLKHDDLRPLFRKRPAGPVSSVGQLWWAEDDDVDLEYHVRLTALPKPGTVRQLLELTSRLHSGLLDRHRPLWEFYLIEGLEGAAGPGGDRTPNRFAIYAKMHHALVDGVAATKLQTRSLSEDPDAKVRPIWAKRPDAPRDPRPTERRVEAGFGAALGQVKSVSGAIRDLAGLAPSVAKLAEGAVRGQSDGVPIPAPRTMFNTSITGGRRFAAQSWDIGRIKQAGAASGATVNDTVLAMCSGALRRYLVEQGELPGKPLVAAVPVGLALRAPSGTGEGGNAVGAVLCNLATDIEDPHQRLAAIRASMHTAKERMAGQSALQLQAMSGLLMGGPGLLSAIPGAADVAPQLFNVIISNVPGSRKPLYWNGARMTGTYPVSIAYEGQALNITVTSYAGNLEVGLIGCRRRVPHLQRLLTYLEESLAELEA